MRKLTMLLILSLVVFVPACGDSESSLTSEANDVMGEMVDLLENVAKEGNADKYKSDLEDLQERGKDLSERIEKFTKDMSTEEKAAFTKKLAEATKEHTDRMMKSMMTLMTKPDVAAEMQKAFKDLDFK